MTGEAANEGLLGHRQKSSAFRFGIAIGELRTALAN